VIYKDMQIRYAVALADEEVDTSGMDRSARDLLYFGGYIWV
jgi:hypothetical protein